MANSSPTNPFLSRGFAPIRMELDCEDLRIEGEIPLDLDGTFYRIGPNPQFEPRPNYNPLGGDGMVHAFRISGGHVSYRNRWVRTQQWELDHAAGRALFGTTGNPADADPSVMGMTTDGIANTNLVWHANRLLALEEGHGPIELDPESLETRGRWSFNDKLPRNMTAHPKIDPQTGEMLFFANFPTGRVTRDIGFYIGDKTGELSRSTTIRAPYPALIHDFAITRDFVIFAVCPVTVSMKRAMAGLPPIAWEPELGLHVGIMPRNGEGVDVRWFAGDSCMVWHLMNAYNEGERIVIDVCAQEVPVFPLADGSPTDYRRATQLLTRWKVDWAAVGAFEVERLSDERCEYPRIDERRVGSKHRYGYVACVGGPGSDDIFHRGIGRFDFDDGRMHVYAAGTQYAVAEPVFAARGLDGAEGDGYLLTNIYDETRDASHLAIFDARQIERGPIARAHLAHRVPVGFHAIWVPGAA